MDYEETMDNQEVEESLPEEIVEEADETEEDLEAFVDDQDSGESEQSEEQPEEPKATAKKEPGYVRDRIDKAVQKALTQERDTIRESLRAEMEAQYAPIRDRLLEMDAKELVRQGEFKSIERAKEYLQLKQGITPQENKQPRNEQGRFVSREEQAEYDKTRGRISELQRQADKIKEKQGIDVIAEYNRNEKVRKAIISGEMDFYDVAESMKPKKRPPSPTRSPNGVNGVGPQSITSMSDAQFKKMDKMLDEGVRFTIRR